MVETKESKQPNEIALQEAFSWARSVNFSDYNSYLGHYQAMSCLDHVRGGALLDMPVGDGFLTEKLAHRFNRIVGVDASSRHLDEARKRLPGAEMHHALIEDFEIAETFGTVTMLNVLEHVEDPVLVLRKAASFLNDEGILIVHVPNALAVNRQIAVMMGTLESCEELSPFDINVVGHRRSYTMDTFKADFSRAGLKIVATGGVFYKMMSTPQIDWFLKNGLWEEGGFGWGRVGAEKRDWKAEFCRACYEYGKQRPEDCNIIYICATKA
jgi:2-polyprenyl-3-methyl-5-hydroxy-6-metoxy-1,4-benzoquinol methylase